MSKVFNEELAAVGSRLKLRRKALGMTLQDVGDKIGVGATTIKRWEDGQIATLKHTRLIQLSRALETTPGYILGFEEEAASSYPGARPIPHTKMVPVIGTINRDDPSLAAQSYDEIVQAPDSVPANFAVRAEGDSMTGARIFDGDIVFCREQNCVNNGEIAAVFVDDRVVLKRVYLYAKSIELRSENPMYPPMVFEGPETADIKIIGKAVLVLGEIR